LKATVSFSIGLSPELLLCLAAIDPDRIAATYVFYCLRMSAYPQCVLVGVQKTHPEHGLIVLGLSTSRTCLDVTSISENHGCLVPPALFLACYPPPLSWFAHQRHVSVRTVRRSARSIEPVALPLPPRQAIGTAVDLSELRVCYVLPMGSLSGLGALTVIGSSLAEPEQTIMSCS
jgi:hypothetical protein